MNIQILNKKLELIQWLSTFEDKPFIEKLLKFRQEETKNWWESISDEKKSIEKGIFEADNNDLKPHSEAKKLYEKWL